MKKPFKRLFTGEEVIKKLSKEFHLEERMAPLELLDILKQHLSPVLCQEIKSIEFRDGIVFLKVQSPLAQHELQARKNQITEIIQKAKPEKIILGVKIF